MDDVGRLDERVRKLGVHFNQANKDIEDILVSSRKITGRGEKIAAVEVAGRRAGARAAGRRRVPRRRAVPRRRSCRSRRSRKSESSALSGLAVDPLPSSPFQVEGSDSADASFPTITANAVVPIVPGVPANFPSP